MKKTFKRFFILTIAIIAMFFEIKGIAAKIRINQCIKQFDNMIISIKNDAPEMIKSKLETCDYVMDISVTISSDVTKEWPYKWYLWNEVYSVVYKMSDDFDKLSIDEQHKIINNLGISANSTIRETIDENYPYYQSYRHSDAKNPEREALVQKYHDDVYGSYEKEIYFRTASNEYMYSGHYDYFLKNGQSIYIDDSSSQHNSTFNTSSQHKCSQCSSAGTHKYESCTGQTEYYCDKHYKELMALSDALSNP